MLVAIGALATAIVIVTVRLDEVRLSPACLQQWWQGGSDENADCSSAIATWSARREEWMFWLLRAAPYMVGIVLGSILVAREIEHRTAQLDWSLSGSRGRWLLERVIPVLVVMVVALTCLATIAIFHESARMPGIDPRASFNEYGTSGLPVVVRGIVVFAGAVLLGSLVGRQLPALILSGALALLIAFGVSAAHPFGAPTEWVAEDAVESPMADSTVETGWRGQDGTILTYEAAAAGAPNPDDAYDWVAEHYERVVRVLAGRQRPEVEFRETVLLGGLALAAVGAASVVVARRRPY